MTISFVQAFPPKWIIINNEGTTAGGAQLFTYDSLTRLPKATYSDPAGMVPLPNPIIFDLNGTFGPIYWKLDSTMPTDAYFIQVFDADGNPLWSENNFPLSNSGGGGGGGGDITTFIPLKNYITNNQFINHIPSVSTPTNITNLILAPSNHRGFTPSLINPIISAPGGGMVSPDIVFNKNNTGMASDQILFQDFALADFPLTGDVTPNQFVEYICSGTPPSGETYKNFQFPITQKVKNLSTNNMTFTLWAKTNSSPQTLTIFLRQYFGSSPTASADTQTEIGTCVLSSTWTQFLIQFPVPTVAGGSLGTPGLTTDDDAVYLQIGMPLGVNCDISFIKPCLYLGTLNSPSEFDSYDQIDSIDSTPRTGDIRVSLQSSAPQGWVQMNNNTIGNTGSGATPPYAGPFMFQLYKTLWDGIDNAFAPVVGGRGASAVADFIANKAMTLPQTLGRALAMANPAGGAAFGSFVGSPTVSFTIQPNNLPPHDHALAFSAGVPSVPITGGASVAFSAAASVTGANATLNLPIALNILNPQTYMNVFIKI